MQARLFSKTGETRGAELELESETLIGRDRQSALVIDQPLMSGRHARIFFDEDDGRFVLEDLDSLNGTELDGDPVSGSERLGHLHVITFAGTYDFFFQDLELCAQRHPGIAGDDAERDAAKPTEPASDGAPSPRSDESTMIDREPIGLPGFLAQRADAVIDQKPPAGATPVTNAEITKIDDKPAFLPDILAKHADRLRAKSDQAEAGPGDPGPGDPGPGGRAPEGTVLEKMPVALPGILAQRIDRTTLPQQLGQDQEIRKADTVDMSDIEELIAIDQRQNNPRPRPGQLQLVVTDNEGRAQRFPLESGDNVVGRSARVQVSLNFRALSRRHATLTVGRDKVTVRDLGSRNRTYLDGEPIEPEVDVEIQAGALLRFGSVEARLTQDHNS